VCVCVSWVHCVPVWSSAAVLDVCLSVCLSVTWWWYSSQLITSRLSWFTTNSCLIIWSTLVLPLIVFILMCLSSCCSYCCCWGWWWWWWWWWWWTVLTSESTHPVRRAVHDVVSAWWNSAGNLHLLGAERRGQVRCRLPQVLPRRHGLHALSVKLLSYLESSFISVIT